MAIITTTSQTELRSSFIRMDPEFFRPEHVAAYKDLNGIKGRCRLGQLCEKITQGSNPTFSKTGLPCVNGKNIYFGTMQDGEPNYVAEKEFERLLNYRLRQNDIVITLKHATKIGRAWIVENKNPSKIFSRNVGLIRLAKASPVIPPVLLMYLWTKSGQLCLDRCATGGTSGQITLPINELKRIPVPPFPGNFQIEIDRLLQRAKQARLMCEKSYSDAQCLLESELGIDRLSFKKPVGYTAQLSEVINNDRVDADFYHKKYKQLDAIARKFTIRKVKEISEKLETGIYSQSYSSEGGNYLRGVDINKGFINSETILKTNLLTTNPNTTVVKDDILVTRVGSIGVCAIIEDNYSGSFFSDNLIRIRLHDNAKIEILAQYLNLLLNTTYGQMQMVRYSRGSVQQRLNQTQLAQIPLPIIDKEIQKKIKKLLDEHRKAEKEFRRLLNQAKMRVEQFIKEARAC